jgi:hypothetical protein
LSFLPLKGEVGAHKRAGWGSLLRARASSP